MIKMKLLIRVPCAKFNIIWLN